MNDLTKTYVVIQELGVLLGVEHLEQRTRRIAIVSTSNLVNLVDEYERVLGLHLLERLDHLSWHRSNVSA